MGGVGADKGDSGPAKYMFWFGILMASSVSIIICNKTIMHIWKFPNSLLIIQNSLAVIMQSIACFFGVKGFDMKPFKLQHLGKWAFVSAIYTGVLFTSLKALPFIAVATTVVFRNLGVLLVSFGDYIMGSKVFVAQHKAGLGIIFVGALTYSYYDMNYHPVGYMWIGLNTIAYAITIHIEKWAATSTDQTHTGISCYQNLLSLPVAACLLVANGEMDALDEFHGLDSKIKAMIFVSGSLGMSLSMCHMSVNKFASATAISVAGNLNKIVSAVVGALVFHSVLRFNAVLGLLVSVGGGMVFAMTKKAELKPIPLQAAAAEVFNLDNLQASQADPLVKK